MAYSVALLTSPEHCAYLKPVAESMELSFDLTFIPYETVAALSELFDSIEDRYDAFCTTGTFSRLLLKRTHPRCTKPIVATLESASDLYRMLLSLLYHDRDCDFSRIYFDFTLWFDRGEDETALDYVDGTKELDFKMYTDLVQSITTERLMNAESIIVERARKLMTEGKLDLLICRHSTAFLKARREGIPCVYAYSYPSTIEQSFRRLEHDLDRIQLEDNIPAVICVTSPELQQIGTEDITPESIDIQKGLLDFNQEKTASMTIKRIANAFELYTTRRVVQRITNNWSHDALGMFLFGRLSEEPAIGYGIGRNINQASSHAHAAMELSAREGGSRLIDEEGSLWERMDKPVENNSANLDRYQAAAAKSGLSPLTIQRIASTLDLLGKREITTQELASALQVTNANANRFIKQLSEAGLAVKVGEKRARLRGRPTRVYRIDL